MVQTMLPKSWKPLKLYFTTVYQEIWVGVALTAYAYYKISYGGKLRIVTFNSWYFTN
ncbi:68MP protein, partial [Rhinopomastus cyanomelas]|nr:68MP protein [Rhinopomastus cyanomelas]